MSKKKIKKKDFIDEILEDETKAKNSSVKTFIYMKNSETINVRRERLTRIRKCGNIIKYAINEDERTKKLLYTETCDSRFCARCQKMKAIKRGQKIFTITNYLKQEKDYEFIFITLTVPNVPGEKLKEEISKINKAIDRLMKRKTYNNNVIKAFITKIEVTYNRKRNDYHPHIHILAAVNKGYFRKSNKDYISQEQLLNDWQEVTNDSSISQVNIQAIKDTDNQTLMKSILEISKYESKSSDFTVNQEVFENFYHALNGSRLLRFNREYKDLALIYDIDKFGLFDDYRLEVDEQGDFTSKLIGNWRYIKKEYDTRIEPLTADEIEFMNYKQEYTPYDIFVINKMQLVKKKAEYGGLIRDTELRLKKQLSSNKTRKTTIANSKDRLKQQKRKYNECKNLYRLYEIIDKDFKSNFVRKS